MEKKMEATMVYWGLYGDNGKENENYYIVYSALARQVAATHLWVDFLNSARTAQGAHA